MSRQDNMDIIKWLQDKIQGLTQPNALSPAVQAINPNVVQYGQNAIQQSAQGKGPELTAAHALAPLAGPIGNLLFGVPNQQAAGMELVGDYYNTKGLAQGAQGLINKASQPVASSLPSTLPKTPVAPTTAMTAPAEEGQVLKEAPKVFTSPEGVQYPFKTASELGGKKTIGDVVDKFLSSPLGKVAEALGITTAVVSQVPNMIGASRAIYDSITGKATAGMTPQTASQLATQADADLGGNPFEGGKAVKLNDLTNAQDKITQIQGSKEYQAKKLTDPWNKYTAPIDAAATQLNTIAKNQTDMLNAYSTALALDQQYNNVINQIQGNTGIGKSSNVYQYVMGSKDPAFGSLQASILALKNQGVPVETILNAGGPTALASLNAAKQQMLTHYNSVKEIYGNSPLTIPAIPPPPPAPTGGVPSSSVIGAPAWAGGGAGGGLPKPGAKGLPPLQPNGLPMKKVQIPPKYLYR